MFNRTSKATSAHIDRIIKSHVQQEDKTLKAINALLSRKDIVNLDNDKVDTLRLLVFHLENKKEMSSTRLIKFIKA